MSDKEQPMTTVHILRRPDVAAATGLRKTQIDRLEARGEFPRRRRLSARAVGWRSDEVQEWIDSRPLADDVRPDPAGDLPRRATA